MCTTSGGVGHAALAARDEEPSADGIDVEHDALVVVDAPAKTANHLCEPAAARVVEPCANKIGNGTEKNRKRRKK